MTLSPEMSRKIKRSVETWMSMWGNPVLARQVAVLEASRLRSALGRCKPDRAEIRIASFLIHEPSRLLDEVICHECAHVAVHARHGADVRPHGKEWQALVRQAGYEPRVRIPAEGRELRSVRNRQRRFVWMHRCPICQMTRMAGRPVPQWRCASCASSGLDGQLVIEKLPVCSGSP